MKTDFWRITLDTNPEDCNLHCIMCEENSPFSNFRNQLYARTGTRKRVMPKEWIEPLLIDAASIGITDVIPTTMGDPLASDNLEEIIRVATALGMKLNITHNGTFPRKSVQEWAALIIPVAKDVKISWNGSIAETVENIMLGLDFQKAIDDLIDFIALRDDWNKSDGHYCTITLQLTFMKQNMGELNDIIQFAASVGVDRIKGHHLWAHFPEIQDQSFKTDNDSIKQWNKIVETAKSAVKKYLLADGKELKLDGFHTLIPNEESAIPDDYECPFLGREVWVSATGEISPCCAPDDLRKSLGSFGNIKDESLSKLLLSESYINLQKKYKAFDLCKTCNMRRPVQ